MRLGVGQYRNSVNGLCRRNERLKISILLNKRARFDMLKSSALISSFDHPYPQKTGMFSTRPNTYKFLIKLLRSNRTIMGAYDGNDLSGPKRIYSKSCRKLRCDGAIKKDRYKLFRA